MLQNFDLLASFFLLICFKKKMRTKTNRLMTNKLIITKTKQHLSNEIAKND